jgi:hypothetical protein
MPDFDLTQAEADALLAMEKHRTDEEHHDFPSTGEKIMLPLVSADRREKFILDISRGRIDFAKCTYQNRARQTLILVRIDLGGPPHRNPDEEEIPCPHIHTYREGYGVKWAQELPKDKFRNPNDLWRTLDDLFVFCNITQPPFIERGLFT